MNKKVLIFSLLAITLFGVIFKTMVNDKTKVEELRQKHAEFLKEHPYQKIGKLPKKERIAKGLPPNAYFEQKYLSEINPATGKTNKENVFKIQEQLTKIRAGQKVPGETNNPWVERGPNNVGGRTRALLFDPNDATNETVFAGGVSGGLWKNTKISDASNKWIRLGIPENLAVSCIVADPNNSQIFYLGTGESYVNGDVNGNGLWKSTDGGNSWSNVFGGVTGNTYLDTNAKLVINTPYNISGNYTAVLTTAFGRDLTNPLTKDLVLVDDGTSPNEDGCTAVSNGRDLNGKIAVIRRGTCDFSAKVKNAQDAGAIAAIIVNNQDTNPFNMAAGDSSVGVTIPALMIGKVDGNAVIDALNNGTVNGTIEKISSDTTNTTVVPGIQHINDIVIRNNSGVSEIFIAAGESAYTGGARLGGDSFGVYKSVDGTNFAKLDIPKTTAGKEHEPNDLEIAEDNSVYLSTIRSSTYGDGGGIIFKSTDGTVFTKVHTITNGIRTQIEVSPINANTVYVLAQMSTDAAPVKMFKTVDNFSTVSELALPNDADNGIPANDFTRGQAFYDLLLKVDPNNENTLYAGGIDLFKSTDGGTSWKQISKWSNNKPGLNTLSVSLVHADQHGLAFASSNKMVFGNDGGVYFSNDTGSTINSRNNNFNTVQFYTVGVAPTTAFGGNEFFLAGSQDNGTHLIKNGSVGINNSQQILGGDGAASFFDTDGSDQYLIGNYIYNQSIDLYNFKTNSWIKVNKEEESKNGDFINQEELDSNLNILYSNYSSDAGNIIKRYSNLLGTITKENLTNNLMNSSPSILKISPYTTTTSKLFVGLKNGKLLKIENANTDLGTWLDITGDGFVGSISDIEFGANENEIFVTMHNYGVVSIWSTLDGGSNWSNKEGDFPDIPVKTILQNPISRNEVIIGTNLGVWKTSNFNAASPNWIQAYNGMSNVPVLDLDLRDDNTVFAATYGRGIFSGKFISDPNGDDDGDGIKNGVDNCPSKSNADQKDTDGDGIGDVCDNCPTVSNADQKDTDGDGTGDVCEDTDSDGIFDTVDNCPTKSNADQKDTDGDGIGDVCDNCPTKSNADQKDTNGNGKGDVCDTSYLDTNNISIQTISETCKDEKDGKIIVNVKQTFVTYKVTLTGDSNVTKDLNTSSVTFDSLKPGSYEVCVEINDKNYKQCFEINIAAAATISLRASKNQESRNYTFNVNSGTAPYNVYLNGNLIDSFNTSIFTLNVERSGILEIETSKSCEDKFSMILDNIFLKQNPVSDTIDLLMPNNAENNINVTVFDVTGKVVL